MAGTWNWFGNGLLNIAKGNVDLDNDTFKMLLATSAYTPNKDTHDFRDDVTNEVSGTGYTAGGATLSGVSVTYDAASGQVQISWTDPTWPSSTITARTAVIYKSRGGAASADELIAYCTESADISSTGGTFTVDLPVPTLYIDCT
ncbi:MAG: hypothetical protein ACRCSL_02215 [Microbacterium sp.]